MLLIRLLGQVVNTIIRISNVLVLYCYFFFSVLSTKNTLSGKYAAVLCKFIISISEVVLVSGI